MEELVVPTLMNFIECYITTHMYKHVFCSPMTNDEEKDLAIQEKIRSLHWVNTHILDAQINESVEGVRRLVDQAITGTVNSPCQPTKSLTYYRDIVVLQHCFWTSLSVLTLKN